jgi:hypothetical protein
MGEYSVTIGRLECGSTVFAQPPSRGRQCVDVVFSPTALTRLAFYCRGSPVIALNFDEPIASTDSTSAAYEHGS